MLVIRSDPRTPSSPSEEHHQPIDLKQDFLHLLQNRQYLILLFGFSIGLALVNTITTLLEQLIKPSGYSSEDAGIFGATIILAGLFNAFLSGILMDRTHAYRLILKVLVFGACVSTIYFILILRPNEFYPLIISIGLMGFFLLPLMPVSFECAVECTYPIRPECSTALLLCLGNFLGAFFTLLVGYLIKLAPQYQPGHLLTPASIFIGCTFLIGGSSLFFYQGAYLRLEAERKATQPSSSLNGATVLHIDSLTN